MGVLDGAIVHDQAFWVVCAVFYAIENFRRLPGKQLILVERINGQWSPTFPIYRYRIGRQGLVILNPLSPWLAAVQMEWLTKDPFAAQHLRRTGRLLGVYQRRLMGFRALSAVLFAIFFVAGPTATLFLGPGFALITILPIHVIAILLLINKLVAERRFWRMAWSDLNSLVFQCALCPGIFINICRRMSLGYARVPGDVIAYALANGGLHSAERIQRRLNLCLDDLTEHEELTAEDEPNIKMYSCRLNRTLDHH
jgi:hypothetical protein